jgi:Flp pilus assembly protein TadG
MMGGARRWPVIRRARRWRVVVPAPARPGVARSDRGSSAVELAVLAPALMMICMLIIQFGLWFNARQAALAAAQAGATVARQEAFTNSNWQADAESAATHYYRALNTKLLGKLQATAGGNRTTDVHVTVQGQLGYSVFPFFGLNFTVSATAGGPVECFRPASLNGAC